MVSYNKLCKLLFDKELKKKDQMRLANLSSSSIVKLTKSQNVTTDMLSKICKALKCDFGVIMEYRHDES